MAGRCSKLSKRYPRSRPFRVGNRLKAKAACIPASEQLDPAQANELMQQFAALGYIEDPGEDKEKAAESAEIEGKYNVARTLLWKGHSEQRARSLRKSSGGGHGKIVFCMQLASCYFQGGYLAQTERLLCAIADGNEPDSASGETSLGAGEARARRSRRRPCAPCSKPRR